MKRISQFLLSFLVLGVIFSCARTPQRIELHPVYVIPRGTPEGPGLPLGVAEGLDTEKVKASTVRVVYGEGDSTMKRILRRMPSVDMPKPSLVTLNLLRITRR